jgi:hypothetical protein
MYKTSVYDFLDEFTNLHLVELKRLTKSYSRKLVASKLNEAFNEGLLFVNYQHRKVFGTDKSIYTYSYFQGESNPISSGLNIGLSMFLKKSKSRLNLN